MSYSLQLLSEKTNGVNFPVTFQLERGVGAGAVLEASRILNDFYEELRSEEFLTFNPSLFLGGSTVDLEESEISGRKTLIFSKTKPISTYLFDFVAGDFQMVERNIEGRSMKMLHRESDSAKVESNLDQIFELHNLSLNWLEDYTGIEYPFQKFDFALIPTFQYGGMEHPGSIFYRERSLMLDESASRSCS